MTRYPTESEDQRQPKVESELQTLVQLAGDLR